ncbi:hypothetical protein [Flavobacterium cerinum]|uniref:Uncharacterized protein n=1 Tax=Flavobacterium cerinum TaxID=2502784 RepID=A0A444HBV5_9FLAO|nr:hypothetical protein [Flavobacterium cerinum]RWX00954.1 hypothetical protein EPI11_07995 [Flavobacterium cerinum]
MSKETKKRNKYNEDILEAVSIRYGVTVDYVRKCLRDVRVGIVPDQIKKEYNQGAKALETVVEKTVQNFINK